MSFLILSVDFFLKKRHLKIEFWKNNSIHLMSDLNSLYYYIHLKVYLLPFYWNSYVNTYLEWLQMKVSICFFWSVETGTCVQKHFPKKFALPVASRSRSIQWWGRKILDDKIYLVKNVCTYVPIYRLVQWVHFWFDSIAFLFFSLLT